MSIMPSLGTATSGINAFQNGITVVSDNIANADTTAFKENDILFSEMISQFSHTGGPKFHTGEGATVEAIRAPFKQGTKDLTDNSLDLMIEGSGFFELKSPTDSPISFYSRAGAFHIDKDGFVVNPAGLQLQGAAINPLTGTAGGGAVAAINLSNIFSPPKATAKVNSTINLFAGEADPFTFVNGIIPTAVTPTDITTGSIFINGIDLAQFGDIPATVEDLIAAINLDDMFALTGVQADVASGEFLKLSNVNGGPIVIKLDATVDPDIAAKTGLQNGFAQGKGGSILTGTVTAEPTQTIITGAGTRFETELRPGDTIVLGDRGYTVDYIKSDTELRVVENIIPDLTGQNAIASARGATFATPVTVFDSTGAAHSINLTFIKLAPVQIPVLDPVTGEPKIDPITGEEISAFQGQWGWSAIVSKNDNVIKVNDNDTVAFDEVQATGVMTFTSDGLLDVNNLPIQTSNGFNFRATATSKALPAPDQEIAFNFEGVRLDGSDATTQFGGGSASTIVKQSQDGHSEGALMKGNLTIDGNGIITGLFTNGTSSDLAQLLLSTFPDEDGLHRVGGNAYIQTTESGAPVLATAGSGGRGKIVSGALENSTVDLTKQFVKLITYQRGFQANSRVITTSDEMIQEIVNLKR
jgi:flagellar hook protein FlgE